MLEADRVAEGASGRNGGFCAASLTHGLHNGLLHFPDELERLEAEGVRNLRELVAFVRNEGIDAELEETGTFDVAAEPWQVEGLHEYVELAAAHGISLDVPRPRRDPGRRSIRRASRPGSAADRNGA